MKTAHPPSEELAKFVRARFQPCRTKDRREAVLTAEAASGAKAQRFRAPLTARLKPCPYRRRSLNFARGSAVKIEERATLCDVLDRVLNKGAVIHGDITIAVADIDLLYVGLRLIVTSIETAMRERVRLPQRA